MKPQGRAGSPSALLAKMSRTFDRKVAYFAVDLVVINTQCCVSCFFAAFLVLFASSFHSLQAVFVPGKWRFT